MKKFAAVFVLLMGLLMIQPLCSASEVTGEDYIITIQIKGDALDQEMLRDTIEQAVQEKFGEEVLVESVLTSKRLKEIPERESEKAPQMESLKPSQLFDPLIADPRWPHFSASYHRYRKARANIGAPNFGAWFTTPVVRTPGGGAWHLGIQTGVFAIFDLGADSNDLINADYYVALPTFTWRKDEFSLLARLFHQSSHLGDEFILHNSIQREDRINLSYEGVDLIASYDLDFLGKDIWRIYGGGSYLFHTDPSDLDPWAVQYGVEFEAPFRLPRQDYFLGFRLQPVAAADFHHRQENNWNSDVSIRAGFDIEAFLGKPLGHRLQFLLEYYQGRSPNGQFYDEDIEYFGFGLHGYLF